MPPAPTLLDALPIYTTIPQAHRTSAGVDVFCSDGVDTHVTNMTIKDNDLDGNEDGILIRDKENEGTHGIIDVVWNEIVNNSGSGVHIKAGTSAADVAVHRNNIVGNEAYGVNNEGTGTLNARANWWGAASGPYDATGSVECQPPGQGGWKCGICDANTDGTGDRITDGVAYCPWTRRESTRPRPRPRRPPRRAGLTRTSR